MIYHIVRVYRSRMNDPSSLIGVVETVGREGRRPFTSYAQLWDILNAREAKWKSRTKGRRMKNGDGKFEENE